MIELVMTAVLFVLAAARIPAVVRNGRDTVFLAAIFAGSSSVLMSPAVYAMLDDSLGGINVVKLALNSSMIIGLWYLRRAVLEAIMPADSRRVLISTLPLTAALLLQLLFFVLAGPTTTTASWGLYHDRLPAALFSAVLITFIGWVCAEVTVACFRYIPVMRRSFKVGFTMVGAGSIVGMLVTIRFTIGLLAVPIPALLALPVPSDAAIRVMEMITIVLVGAGLTVPAVAGRRRRKRQVRWEADTLAGVEPIRERILQRVGPERFLESDPAAPARDRLHRMIVEVWDAELASGGTLAPEERAFLLAAEKQLALNRLPRQGATRRSGAASPTPPGADVQPASTFTAPTFTAPTFTRSTGTRCCSTSRPRFISGSSSPTTATSRSPRSPGPWRGQARWRPAR